LESFFKMVRIWNTWALDGKASERIIDILLKKFNHELGHWKIARRTLFKLSEYSTTYLELQVQEIRGKTKGTLIISNYYYPPENALLPIELNSWLWNWSK
jgi:hypothetical protein